MRHGQGFELVLSDWLRLADAAPDGRPEPLPVLARYEPRHRCPDETMLDHPSVGLTPRAMLATLARLATQMHLGALRLDGRAGTIPAGYTYLGQFAVHDLVNSASFRTTLDRNLPRRLFGNTQSPALDLASLYGGGPTASPVFFEPTDETEHRGRFRLGRMRDGDGRPGVAEDIPRLALGPATGEDEADRRHDPLLADTRNADNLILSQLVVLFMQAHNRLYDLGHAGAVSGRARHALFARPFEAARCMLTSAYRRILRHDWLPRFVSGAALARHFAPGARPHGDISLEAAMAVLRFGHAMVQPAYDFSATHSATGAAGAARIERLMDFFGMRPTRDIPVQDNWVIDWSLFFPPVDGKPPHPRMNMARPLGPFLAEPLRTHAATRVLPHPEVPELAGFRLGLAFRTMAKGMMARLPSGQGLAAAMLADGLIGAGDILSTDALDQLLREGRTAACIGERCLTDADIAMLRERTPLFWYILAEARLLADGERLGPVGSEVLAATFATGLADPGHWGQDATDATADALWAELFPGGPDIPRTMPALVAFVRGPG